MNERQVSEAIVDWIGEVAGIDAGSRFPYPVATVTAALPIVAGLADRKRTARVQDVLDLFPQLQLQQHRWVRVFECSASIMVEVDQSEADAKAKFQQLQGWGEALELAAWSDDTLGDRVPFVSPALAFDYSPAFEELDDGLRGRTFTIVVVVGELVDADPE